MIMNLNVSALGVMKETFNAKDVRELKVPVHVAAKQTEDNGLDEVFFSMGGKDYVAFGDNLKFDAMSSLAMLSFKNEGVEIQYFQDETNSAGEGAKSALNSGFGKTVKYGATGLGAAAGVALALLAGGMASRPQFIGMGSTLLMAGLGGGIGAAVGYGGTAAVGAAYGAARGSDMDSIDAITKK